MTASSRSITANLVRPRSPSISRPKYQKMPIVRTSQMPGWLASGQVRRRQTSPPRTASGSRARFSQASWLAAHTNIVATDASTTSIVVLTSSVPMRNHGSLALRRSGTENEKRPAMGLNRILDT
jgi:hypothetical protein